MKGFHGLRGTAIFLVVGCCAIFSVSRAYPVDVVWTNAAGGDWSVANNWTPNMVPGSTDHAIVTNSVTVTLSVISECGTLTLGNIGNLSTLTANADLVTQDLDLGGTLNGTGTVTVSNAMNWGAGTMSGSGRTVIAPGATLSLVNPGFVQLIGWTLENGGTVLWTGNGDISLTSSAVIANDAEALFDVQTDASFSSVLGSGSRIDNMGTFRKLSGARTNSVATSVSFNNYGTMEIRAGTFQCGGPLLNDGTITLFPGTTNRMAGGGSGNGIFEAPASALMDWAGGNFTLGAGAELNGDGLYKFSVGTVTANTDLAIKNLNITFGTLSANASLTIDTLNLAAGTLDCSGYVIINTEMNWIGGNMTGSGVTLIPANVTLTINNPSFVRLSTRTLENAGTILWMNAGDITLTDHAVITNRPGALFLVQNAANFSSVVGSGSRIDNAGIFRKSGNTGVTSIATSIGFNNYADLEIESGTILCGGTFTNAGVVNLAPGTTNRFTGSGLATGSFNVPPTALVEWNTGNFALEPGAQLNGSGLYKVSGATLIGDTNVVIENLDLTGGALDGPNIFTINHAMNWISGNMIGSGRTYIPWGATLSIANSFSFIQISGRTLDNAGTVVWTGSQNITLNIGAVITNEAGGLFDIQNGQPFATVGANRIDNAGVFRKSVSAGTTTFNSGVSLTNYGTIEIRKGILMANGACALTSNSVLNCAIGGTNVGTGYGRLQAAGLVTIDGTLRLDLINGFLPTTNDTFTVVTNATRKGSFTSFAFPSNEVAMQLNLTPNFVIVQVTAASVPPPLFLTPVLSGSNILLTWTAVSNATYRLEFNSDLSSSSWTALPGEVVAVADTANKLDSVTPGNRFYRVHVIQ